MIIYWQLFYQYFLFKKEPFFPPPLGLFGTPDHILQDICLKPWRGFIFGPYAHFLLMKFFSKNFFRFFFNPQGPPFGFLKNRKKISLIKNVDMDQK